MPRSKDNENFISGIHNYCDRWCERCEFTRRCSIYAAEQEMTDEEKDVEDPETFVRNLSNIFAEAKQMILEGAEKFGIEFEPMSDDEFEQIQERTRKFIDAKELFQLADKYGRDTRPVLDAKSDWLIYSPGEDHDLDDALGSIYWYQYFIAAKIRRAFHGLLDIDGYEELENLDDTQSDANGSAKLALIAADRSINAWSRLLAPGNAETIRPRIVLLEKIKLLTNEQFPLANDFIRPGFDEVETVM